MHTGPIGVAERVPRTTGGPRVLPGRLADAANRVSGACLDAVAGESAKWTG